MKNIEFYAKELSECSSYEEAYSMALSHGLIPCECIEVPQELFMWLNEEHQILNKKEKKYLNAVIKPFRNRIIHIVKYTKDYVSFIKVSIYDDDFINYIELPYFNEESMYLGMESNKEYTLKELGL